MDAVVALPHREGRWPKSRDCQLVQQGSANQEPDPRLSRRPNAAASLLAALLSIALALLGLKRAPCQQRASTPGPSRDSLGSGS